MPKGQRVVIDKFKSGPKTELSRMDIIIDTVNDHDERLNDLEKTQEMETTIVLKDGIPYYASMPMLLDAIVTQ